jgi:hypothetical protein
MRKKERRAIQIASALVLGFLAFVLIVTAIAPY